MTNKDFKIEAIGGFFQINLDPELYPLDVITSAAYSYLDKAYIFLSGDKNKEIIVNLKPKNETFNKEKITLEFSEALLNYLEYKNNYNNNKEIRQMILQRAIVTNDPEMLEENFPNKELSDDEFKDLFKGEDLEEIENIAMPWEEKYKKNEQNNN